MNFVFVLIANPAQPILDAALVQTVREQLEAAGALATAALTGAAAAAAFAHAYAGLPFAPVPLLAAERSDLKALEAALGRLSQLWPLQKPQLLKAMARGIEHDGRITAEEAELMRAVADILDCPMPPLLSQG